MGLNDEYSYYYNSITGSQTAQNNYSNDQSRRNQDDQNNQQNSSSALAHYYSYQQQAYNQEHVPPYEDQGYCGNAHDNNETAAETLRRMSSTATSTATAYNQTQEANTYNSNHSQLQNTGYSSSSSSTLQHRTVTGGYPTTGMQSNNHTTAQARPTSVTRNSLRSVTIATRSPSIEPTQRTRANASAQYARTRTSNPVQRPVSPAQIQASRQPQWLAGQRGREVTQLATDSNQQTFVDPSAVYDPWPEYQRKLAAARAAKEAEDCTAAEREAEEKREAEEESKRQEEEKTWKRMEDKERKKVEAARKRAEAKFIGTVPKLNRKSKAAAEAETDGTAGGAMAEGLNLQQLASMANAVPSGSNAEAQIRQLMAMVKQMNDKHPDLLAKIWEEERKQQLDKASTETPKPFSPNANKAARGATWQSKSKIQIAVAAVRCLNALPGNRGRSLVVSQVATMLDRDPTYIELCEMIEQLGFEVERVAFAKALVASVPYLNTNGPGTSTAIPQSLSGGLLQTPVGSPPSKPAEPASSMQTINMPPIQPSAKLSTRQSPPGFSIHESSYLDQQGQQIPTSQTPRPTISRTKQDRKASESKRPESMNASSNQPSETPGPVTKAEAARKRTFADLVDLTTLSEDELPPAKHMYFGPPPVAQPGRAYSSQLDFLPNFGSVADPHLQRSVNWYSQALPSSSEQQQMTAAANKLTTMELGKSVDKKNALRRSRYDIRTLARDVLLATGKHPDLLPLNGHLEPLRSVFASSIHFNTDLSTVRWDLIDPGEPVPEALASVVAYDKDSVIDADDESEEEVRHFAFRAPSHSRPVAVGADDARLIDRFLDMPTQSTNSLVRGKKVPSRGRGRSRGRPPGIARSSTGGAQTPIGNHPAPAPSATSPAAGIPSRGGSSYSSFTRELRPDGTKKRGRPVGWRKHLHQRGLGTEAGGSGHTPVLQQSKPAPDTPASEPKFAVYMCQWKSCGAQLHNLETLRRHVKKKHSGPDDKGKFTCLWMDCGRRSQAIDGEGSESQASQHYEYPDTTELIRHVEQAHVTPIAWKLGDGPPGGFSDSNASDVEAYLSDRQGRRVTPTILAAAPGSGRSPVQRSGRRGRPPKKSDEEKAKESQAELAKRKREIGLGVDREGATFANEKRRAGFVDDEDGDEVLVDASD